MKRSALALIAALWCATSATSATTRSSLTTESTGSAVEAPPVWNRFEIALSGGYGRSRAGGTSTFLRESATAFYTRLSASDAITLDSAAAVHVGGSCTFYLTPAFGIQVGFGYLKSAMTGGSDFRLEAFRDAPVSRQVSWSGSGEITAVPLSLNLTVRSRGETVRGRVSGGPTLFLNAFMAGVPAGIEAVEPVLADEKLDILQVAISVADTTWIAVGANLGAGLDFAIGKNAALSIEAGYFLCPVKTFAWDWTTGFYSGLDRRIANWNFTADAARAAGQKTSSLRIDPSFFQISAGVRFFFPGPRRD